MKTFCLLIDLYINVKWAGVHQQVIIWVDEPYDQQVIYILQSSSAMST